MGIKGLFPFLAEAAPAAIAHRTINDFTNRMLAIDASTCLYQFIIAVRAGSESEGYSNLTNERGEITSHINGFLMRTIKLMEAGIKPIYVFDGAAPQLKAETLRARGEKKAEAAAEEVDARAADLALDAALREAAEAAKQADERLALLPPPAMPAADASASAAAAAAAAAVCEGEARAAAAKADAEAAAAAVAVPEAPPAEAEARMAAAEAARAAAAEAEARAAAAAAAEAEARAAAAAASEHAAAAAAAAAAREALVAAQAAATGGKAAVEKAARRSAKVTRQHALDAMCLLRLMGVPVLEAPGEAEATCAALCKAGLVYAAVSEDMDLLTFGAERMLKNLFDTETARAAATSSAAKAKREGAAAADAGGSGAGAGSSAAAAASTPRRAEGGKPEKKPVYEISLPTVLQQLDLSMPQFIDLCLLCGCDYLPPLPKVGPPTAIKAIHSDGAKKCIEGAIEAKALPPAALDVASSTQWPFEAARRLFDDPAVVVPPASELQQREADFVGLSEFLVSRHSFAQPRVEAALKRLRAVKAAKTQMRLDQFFTPQKAASAQQPARYDPFAKKRKAAEPAGAKVAGSKPAKPPAKGQGAKRAK